MSEVYSVSINKKILKVEKRHLGVLVILHWVIYFSVNQVWIDMCLKI